MDALWQRFLPEIIERVNVLESAAMAIAGCELAPQQREAAQAAAHKLAGVLGSFGLARGTDLARELELAFTGESSLDAQSAANFSAIAAELRKMVESRKTSA
ncbi:MAG: Hpt domain-containing protein [Terracidiphilus sp.]